MKLSLSQNICKLRKSKRMTQEQLAEALGVTFAAISKWERGIATPELHLIARMADLFGVSLDALVGFEAHNSSITATEKRIHDLQRKKQYTDAMMEAEKALLRYPNDFRIVYRSGQVYALAGLEEKEECYLTRSIALLEQAVSLLSQNTDPEISEASIQGEIAQCHLVSGNTSAGLEILKKYNVNGVNNALIAVTYTTEEDHFDPKQAEPYMLAAFTDIIVLSTRTMLAYANYYHKLGNYAAGRDSLIWLIEMLQSIKIDPNARACVDKLVATCYFECAALSSHLGESKKVGEYLRRAYQAAVAFDAAPIYQFDNIKFCVGDNVSKATIYDDIGESAMGYIERRLTGEDRNESLLTAWKQIIEKEHTRGAE